MPQKTWTHSGLGTLSASLTSNGQSALVATVDQGVQYWDLQKNQEQFKLKHLSVNPGQEANIELVALAEESPFALTYAPQSIILWDLETGKALRNFQLSAPLLCVALSRTGRYALLGFSSNKAEIIDLVKGITIKRFDLANSATAVAISQDGRYVVIGSEDFSVRVWDLNTGDMVQQWFHKHTVTQVGISPNNAYILSSAAHEKTYIRDRTSGNIISTLIPGPKWTHAFHYTRMSVSSLFFDRDNKSLYTGSAPRNIRRWDIQSGDLLQEWVIPNRKIWRPSAAIVIALTVTPDQQSVICQTTNGMGYQFSIPQT